MIAHTIIAVLVFLAFAYSVYSGVQAIRTMDNCKSGPRCVAILIVIIGVLYLAESIILYFQGDHIVIHPLAAIVTTLSVAVNLLAIKIFIKESTNNCAEVQCILNKRENKQ